jgi:hypothetical protein
MDCQRVAISVASEPHADKVVEKKELAILSTSGTLMTKQERGALIKECYRFEDENRTVAFADPERDRRPIIEHANRMKETSCSPWMFPTARPWIPSNRLVHLW